MQHRAVSFGERSMGPGHACHGAQLSKQYDSDVYICICSFSLLFQQRSTARTLKGEEKLRRVY